MNMRMRYSSALVGLVAVWGAPGAHAQQITDVDEVIATSSSVVSGTADAQDNGVISAAPTQAQADAEFAAARKSFMAVAEGAPPSTKLGDVVQKVDAGSVKTDKAIPGGGASDVALENIKLVLDVEDVSLREVVTRIVGQAAQYTGPWTVKWRLRPENADLMDERVNLTVEAKFGEFCELLAEKIKNLTGTQIFVTAFKGSRTILITDTYY